MPAYSFSKYANAFMKTVFSNDHYLYSGKNLFTYALKKMPKKFLQYEWELNSNWGITEEYIPSSVT